MKSFLSACNRQTMLQMSRAFEVSKKQDLIHETHNGNTWHSHCLFSALIDLNPLAAFRSRCQRRHKFGHCIS